MDRDSLITIIAILTITAIGAYLLVAWADLTGGEEPEEQPVPPLKPQPTPECTEGGNVSCTTSDNCSGYQLCINDHFTSCMRQLEVCLPGSKHWCTITGCAQGYMYCDRCGSGYGECFTKPCTQGANGTNSTCLIEGL